MQEFYGDFVAIDPYHFTLNMPSNHIYMIPAVVDPPSLQHFCDRVVDGIAALFLALKQRPVIRYQRTSDVAKRIAQETSVRKFLRLQVAFCYFNLSVNPSTIILYSRSGVMTSNLYMCVCVYFTLGFTITSLRVTILIYIVSDVPETYVSARKWSV